VVCKVTGRGGMLKGRGGVRGWKHRRGEEKARSRGRTGSCHAPARRDQELATDGKKSLGGKEEGKGREDFSVTPLE